MKHTIWVVPNLESDGESSVYFFTTEAQAQAHQQELRGAYNEYNNNVYATEIDGDGFWVFTNLASDGESEYEIFNTEAEATSIQTEHQEQYDEYNNHVYYVSLVDGEWV